MSRDRAAGFTLLEVVIGLAIAGLALVGLFQAGSGGLVATTTAGRVEEAVQRAQSHLAAIGRNAAIAEGDSDGDDGGGFHWRLRVRPMAARAAQRGRGGSTAATTLFEVTVAISWTEHGQVRSVTLTSLRLGAASTSPG